MSVEEGPRPTLTQLVAANAAAAAAGAGKKAAQVQLQAELNTDEDWRKFLLRDGLLVVDVYSEWCGPCIGMVGNLKKIKVEIGGDNLHLAIAKADTIEVLKRFRNRSEPTWMFIAAGQLLNVVFGADAPRLARTIEQELKYEELARKGERTRPSRLPHELTPEEQVVAEALAARAEAKQAREREAVLSAREARREARARRLEAHFAEVCPVLMMPHSQKHLRKVADALEPLEISSRREARTRRLEAHFAEVCPVLMMPHSQKHLRKVADALEPLGVTVADKCPLLVGAEGARILAVEDPTLGAPPALAALVERPSLTLLLKKLPEKDGDVLELVRRGLCGDGLPDEEKPKKTVLEELTAEGVPGLFVPADRHARAVALDLLFPKMVGSVVEPPAPPEPPHIALVYGAWQRRAVLAAAAALTPFPAAPAPAAPVVLRYGFFADASVEEPRLLCKTLEKYEERPEKDYCETLVLMAAVGPADPVLSGPSPSGPPATLLAL
ncbi:unnamed protein product [Plutella xylostella]|uniref:(diamondback moth) hypothetical protein n=1 Tax=Plutella xylostella TaxID=51655 RepID=A0A8S4F5A2_PLUXY|nr:unnamed protein product [Plutella xylostella]